MYPLIRPLLFRLDPEQAHSLSLGLLRLAGALPPLRAFLRAWFRGPQKPVRVFGLDFANPVGLAAGYDKDGQAWRSLACLGFGHIEIGTVTLKPQAGNPPPRLFRLPEEKALINRLGFPGRGAAFVRSKMPAPPPSGLVLGVNIGKNRDTPLETAALDYIQLIRIFWPAADYLAINVSSPNTAGLRRLQARQALEDLLSELAQERERLQAGMENRRVPLLVKLAPDLTDAELDDALDAILRTGMDGVIATNTTVQREGVRSPLAGEPGGLSGAPLRRCSTEMVRKIASLAAGNLPIVAAGGIMGADGAREKLNAGAVLVQIYTGLVYAGPGLVKQILHGLDRPIRGSQS